MALNMHGDIPSGRSPFGGCIDTILKKNLLNFETKNYVEYANERIQFSFACFLKPADETGKEDEFGHLRNSGGTQPARSRTRLVATRR